MVFAVMVTFFSSGHSGYNKLKPLLDSYPFGSSFMHLEIIFLEYTVFGKLGKK